MNPPAVSAAFTLHIHSSTHTHTLARARTLLCHRREVVVMKMRPEAMRCENRLTPGATGKQGENTAGSKTCSKNEEKKIKQSRTENVYFVVTSM